jgi:hypothetical protein
MPTKTLIYDKKGRFLEGDNGGNIFVVMVVVLKLAVAFQSQHHLER